MVAEETAATSKSSGESPPHEDGDGLTKKSLNGAREVRKRNRLWLSCDPCHRMKVKCDRGQPCSRCARGDRIEKCVYETAKKAATNAKISKEPLVRTSNTRAQNDALQQFAQERMMKYRKGKVRHGGRTHWALIAHEFQEVKDVLHDSSPESQGANKKMKDVKKFFPQKRLINYPFSPSREPRYSSREGIIATLPDQELVRPLVDIYFETFEKTHSLFHEATFKAALSTFYDDPTDAQPGWIACLFLMLALSYQAASRYSLEASSISPSAQVEIYLEGAQAALHLAPFMLKPTLENLQALCMVAIGKAIDIVTLDDSDTLYMFTGFILRYAYMLGMHRDPQFAPGMPLSEAQARRKIWTTILFLDLRTSIESGMPLLIRSTDYDTLPPQDAFDTLIFRDKETQTNELAPSSYQHRLAQSSKVVSDIVSIINSPSPDLKYEQVLEYDQKLRNILHHFPALDMDSGANNPTHLLQRCALSIFIHRVLLALHQPYATDPHAWRDYQTSHYSVLQCSLAILSLQRLIHESSDSPVPVGWLHELYRHDFMVAALYLCVALRRDQFSDAAGGVTKEQARKTAWDTILGVKEIKQKECTLSVHHCKVYLGIVLITEALKALEKGTPCSQDTLLASIEEVTTEITDRLGASAHSTGSSSNDTAQNNPQDFMFFDSMGMDPTFFSQPFDFMTPDVGATWGPTTLGFDYMGQSLDDPTKRPWPQTLWR